jgi:hypothetical protein
MSFSQSIDIQPHLIFSLSTLSKDTFKLSNSSKIFKTFNLEIDLSDKNIISFVFVKFSISYNFSNTNKIFLD